MLGSVTSPADQMVLNDILWPSSIRCGKPVNLFLKRKIKLTFDWKINRDKLVHDSYQTRSPNDKTGSQNVYPSIGSAFLGNVKRSPKIANECPEAFRPTNHWDWQYCWYGLKCFTLFQHPQVSWFTFIIQFQSLIKINEINLNKNLD